MATTTAQRFRRGDADWTPPKTATKITTRSSPLPKIPRDEQVRIARPLGGGVVTRRPTPLDLRLAQAKSSVRLVSNSQDQHVDSSSVETLRDPEIVDLAGAPVNARNWTTRRKICPPCPPRQPPPVPPKPRRAPPPSVASRQSEMSFGILDYYIHDPSPAQSPSLACGGTTPAVGETAIDRFDFGLGERIDATRKSDDAKSGADEDEMQLIPLSPRPFEEEQSESPPKTNRKKKQYSLFPAVQEVTPSSNRLARVINESPNNDHSQRAEQTTPYRQQESSWRPRLLSGAKMTPNNTNTRHRTDTISSSSPTTITFPSPTTTIPSPSYHPRKSSRSFSINMNANNNITTRLPSTSISSGSGSNNSNSARGSSSTASRTRTISNPHHIPLRILSSSSTATTATSNTHNTASRSSVSTSPGSTLAGQQKPLLSRWSEDTALASPTTAAHASHVGGMTGAGGLGCRASFGSLLAGDGGLRMGSEGVYPDCFFEDDDEDCFERGSRRSRRTMGRGGQRGWKWKWLVCCGGRKG